MPAMRADLRTAAVVFRLPASASGDGSRERPGAEAREFLGVGQSLAIAGLCANRRQDVNATRLRGEGTQGRRESLREVRKRRHQPPC